MALNYENLEENFVEIETLPVAIAALVKSRHVKITPIVAPDLGIKNWDEPIGKRPANGIAE